MANNEETKRMIQELRAHYYGDIVRRLLFIVGVIMLLTLPVLKEQLLPAPTFISVLCILVIGLVAGITNPMQQWAMMINTGVALIGFVVFEYRAVVRFDQSIDSVFLITQCIALFFFIALYFSTKTVRGTFLRGL